MEELHKEEVVVVTIVEVISNISICNQLMRYLKISLEERIPLQVSLTMTMTSLLFILTGVLR